MKEKPLKFVKNPNKSNFYRVLGPRIARLRQSRGLVAAEVAKTLGITEETYNSLETGDLKMPQEILFKIEKLLKVSHFEMIAGRSESEIEATVDQVCEDIETLAMYQQMSKRKREALKPKVREIIARSATAENAAKLEAELLGKK